MSESIKGEMNKIHAALEKQLETTWDIIAMLDFDPVSGNSPKIDSRLARDLVDLQQLIQDAKIAAGRIADYQSYNQVTYNPRKPRK